MPARPFRLEDIFGSPDNPPPTEPEYPGEPKTPGEPPTGPVVEPLPPGGGYPGPLPPLDDPNAPVEPPPVEGGPVEEPVPGGGYNDPLPPLDSLIPAASPTSATSPGSFADPGSAAARPLQPFNYRSLFDVRNRTQGSLVPGARVPRTPANIAPQSGGVLGGQSESAITKALRRLRG